MGEFRMPSLGADMEWGILVQWLVRPGEPVRHGDIVATVETQKGLFDVEIFDEGIMGEPLVQSGVQVPVGTLLAMILPIDATLDAGSMGSVSAPAALQPEQVSAAISPGYTASQGDAAVSPKRVACSPSARRLAAELGVDIAEVRGTGPHGAIQRSDVEQAAQARQAARVLAAPAAEAAPGRSDTEAVDIFQQGMRQAIAAAMSRSNREIPHYYLEMDIDMSHPLRWLEGENMKRSIRERILPAALLLKGVARALVDVPELNGYWLDGRLQVKQEMHIGFAVALRQGGLVTPAIHNVDRLSLDEVMSAMGDLVERTRSGRLRSSEVIDTTITVTNLGDRGVRTVFGVIYPPQVALVAFGRISERPWAEEGLLGVRRCVAVTLAADHRATDGHRGSQFLEALNRHLQQPEQL